MAETLTREEIERQMEAVRRYTNPVVIDKDGLLRLLGMARECLELRERVAELEGHLKGEWPKGEADA